MAWKKYECEIIENAQDGKDLIITKDDSGLTTIAYVPHEETSVTVEVE